MAGQKTCGLEGCMRNLKPGGARVGYEIDNHLFEVVICSYHLNMVAMGGYQIVHTKADKPFIKPTPARPIIIK